MREDYAEQKKAKAKVSRLGVVLLWIFIIIFISIIVRCARY